uniref:SHSP domain-containing protein n=1 Tax=Graphocephala atropunctata TaxID=36148 RepID=A0A1B6MJY5_9HEMI
MEVDSTCCYPCQFTVTPRGNFFSDKYFDGARKTLNDLVAQMQNSCNRQVQWPPGRVDCLLAELGAWQQSGQSLGATMGAVRHDNLFTTVFRFEPDTLKMLVDVKGFQPFNMKLNVNEETVELIASQEEASSNPPVMTRSQNCVGYMRRNISRKYILPQKLVKESVQCSLSADGILFIMAPWLRC